MNPPVNTRPPMHNTKYSPIGLRHSHTRRLIINGMFCTTMMCLSSPYGLHLNSGPVPPFQEIGTLPIGLQPEIDNVLRDSQVRVVLLKDAPQHVEIYFWHHYPRVSCNARSGSK